MKNVCYDILDYVKYDKNEIEKNNKKVYNELKKFLKGNNKTFNVSEKLIEKTFYVMDKIYFSNEISKFIKKSNSTLLFVINPMKTAAGMCKYSAYYDEYGEIRYGDFEIQIANNIVNNLFNEKNVKSLKINGLHCFDRLECYINLYQHEIIHLLTAIFCHNDVKKQGGHTIVFRNIVYLLFGHTEYKHALMEGDSIKNEKKLEFNKLNVEIGDSIITKELKNKKISGKVIKKCIKNIVIDTKDGNYIISYSLIDKIKKGKKSKNKIIKKSNLSEDEIRKKLKINSKIKVKLRGDVVDGKVLKINPKRALIEVNGEKWNFPYNLIII